MFGRKAKPVEPCAFCDRPIKVNQKVCLCGQGTPYMDFSERTRHEVEEWRRTQNRPASRSA